MTLDGVSLAAGPRFILLAGEGTLPDQYIARMYKDGC